MKLNPFKKQVRGFCPKCGAQIHLHHDIYCMKCGHQLKKDRFKGSFGIIKAGIVILLVLAAIVAIRYFQGKPIIPDFFTGNMTK